MRYQPRQPPGARAGGRPTRSPAHHKLRFNGAAYYYDYKNNQVLTYRYAVAQLIRNAAARNKGAPRATAQPRPRATS